MADKIKIITTKEYTQELTQAEISAIITEKEQELALWNSRLQQLKAAAGTIFEKRE